MQTHHLALFLETLREGSYAAVARRRDLDPSQVSRAVAALERELGVRLLSRSTRRMSPTEAGQRFAARIQGVVEELEHASAAARDTSATPQGTLRMTAPVSFAQRCLVPLLPGFTRAHPAITLDLVLSDRRLDLVADRIDLAIRLGALPDSSLVARKLCDMRYVLCASPALAARAPSAPEGLAELPCLAFPLPGVPPVWRFRRGERGLEVPISGPVAASNALVLRELAIAGQGFAVLARWVVGHALASGALVPVLSDWEVTGTRFDAAAWLVRPSRAYTPLKVRAMSALLREAFAEGPPWQEGL